MDTKGRAHGYMERQSTLVLFLVFLLMAIDHLCDAGLALP